MKRRSQGVVANYRNNTDYIYILAAYLALAYTNDIRYGTFAKQVPPS